MPDARFFGLFVPTPVGRHDSVFQPGQRRQQFTGIEGFHDVSISPHPLSFVGLERFHFADR